MRAIMVMFDSLNKNMLPSYGCDWINAPNFKRLAQKTASFNNCYVGSMPCMPARREIHTGRYNFLHRNWGPIEPFDDSMPEILKSNGIHTHLITDHYHYFEDGGATYHTRYRTYENFRGQEGDAWKANVCDEFSNDMKNGRFIEQDDVNRQYLNTEDKHSQTLCFDAGVDFINTNIDKQNWFLTVETFDPHEPFFSYEKYKELYKHDYEGKVFDWPPYAKVSEDDKTINHLRMEYAALVSMCDYSLGRILDLMDEHDMWQDTLLIVNTDHGFMLGEHGHWAKCYFPFYNEIANTPLFMWDPRYKKQNCEIDSLVQTIDMPATLLEFFGVSLPKDMQGVPLAKLMEKDEKIRDGALFGIFGGQIGCTDGRYVYLRSPKKENTPLNQYTLMPLTRCGGRRGFFKDEELQTMELSNPFAFTKNMPVMKIKSLPMGNKQYLYDTMLFDLQSDPKQEKPINDEKIEKYMLNLMIKLMKENDCPEEQFERMNIK